MSINITLARPYAKAAFEFASQHNESTAWQAFLQSTAMIVADQRVVVLLQNPRVSQQDKLAFLCDVQKGGVSQHQQNFLAVLAKKGRLQTLPDVYALFMALLREQEKTVNVAVTTAFEINQEQVERLKQALEIRLQKTVALNVTEDRTLLGGAVIRAGDFVIDGSSRSKLQRLHKALVMG